MRTAVDTNVVLRFLIADDEKQSALAQEIFAREQIVLLPTVILEVEWVLRTGFRFDARMRDEAFSVLIALPNVEIVEEDHLMFALSGLRAGMDFADALHLAGSADCDQLVTFDRDFARRAADTPDAIPVRLL